MQQRLGTGTRASCWAGEWSRPPPQWAGRDDASMAASRVTCLTRRPSMRESGIYRHTETQANSGDGGFCPARSSIQQDNICPSKLCAE